MCVFVGDGLKGLGRATVVIEQHNFASQITCLFLSSHPPRVACTRLHGQNGCLGHPARILLVPDLWVLSRGIFTLIPLLNVACIN